MQAVESQLAKQAMALAQLHANQVRQQLHSLHATCTRSRSGRRQPHRCTKFRS